MEYKLQLIKKIAPDLTEEIIKRYRVLKTVKLLQPCGRRMVVVSLGMTERTVRSEIERLSALLEGPMEGAGTSIDLFFGIVKAKSAADADQMRVAYDGRQAKYVTAYEVRDLSAHTRKRQQLVHFLWHLATKACHDLLCAFH